MNTVLFEAKELSYCYRPPRASFWTRRGEAQTRPALSNISFALRHGQTLGVVGESGCGKTTLARIVAGLIRPDAGQLLFHGRPTSAANRPRIQMVFQDPASSLNPRWRIGQIVAEPARLNPKLKSRTAVRERVGQALEQVGLTADIADRYAHEFSGGQRQRIAIARALLAEPDILICDEPSSALDVSMQAQILNLLARSQQASEFGCLFVSHDLAVVRQICAEIAVMRDGEFVEQGSTPTVIDQPRHPYTRSLMFDARQASRSRSVAASVLSEPAQPD